MDVDCDGANNSRGKCANDPTGQSITAFQDEVSTFGIKDLDANLHSYVILGTKGFDPRDVGVESLGVVAVVCNNQLVNDLQERYTENTDTTFGLEFIGMNRKPSGNRRE